MVGERGQHGGRRGVLRQRVDEDGQRCRPVRAVVLGRARDVRAFLDLEEVFDGGEGESGGAAAESAVHRNVDIVDRLAIERAYEPLEVRAHRG